MVKLPEDNKLWDENFVLRVPVSALNNEQWQEYANEQLATLEAETSRWRCDKNVLESYEVLLEDASAPQREADTLITAAHEYNGLDKLEKMEQAKNEWRERRTAAFWRAEDMGLILSKSQSPSYFASPKPSTDIGQRRILAQCRGIVVARHSKAAELALYLARLDNFTHEEDADVITISPEHITRDKKHEQAFNILRDAFGVLLDEREEFPFEYKMSCSFRGDAQFSVLDENIVPDAVIWHKVLGDVSFVADEESYHYSAVFDGTNSNMAAEIFQKGLFEVLMTYPYLNKEERAYLDTLRRTVCDDKSLPYACGVYIDPTSAGISPVMKKISKWATDAFMAWQFCAKKEQIEALFAAAQYNLSKDEIAQVIEQIQRDCGVYDLVMKAANEERDIFAVIDEEKKK